MGIPNLLGPFMLAQRLAQLNKKPQLPQEPLPKIPEPIDFEQELANMEAANPPRKTATDAYLSLMNQMPNMADYKPGLWRKVAGVMAGLGANSPAAAMETTHQAIYKPYYTRLGDWQNKQQGLSRAAALEETANKADESYRQATLSKKVTQRGQDIKIATEARKRAIDEYTAQTRRFLAENSKTVVKLGEDQRYHAYNPVTHEDYVLPFKAGEMPDDMLEELRQKGRLQITNITQAGANARSQASIRAAAERQQAGFEQQGKMLEARTNAQSRLIDERAQHKGIPTVEQQKIEDASIRDVLGLHKELEDAVVPGTGIIDKKTKKYVPIQIDPNNPNAEELWKLVYPVATLRKSQYKGVTKTNPQTEKRIVVMKDGKKFSLPKSQLKDAIAQGYTEVK